MPIRSIQRAFLAGLFRLPHPVLRGMSGGRAVVHGGKTLDPHLQMLLRLTGLRPPLEQQPIAKTRRLQRDMASALGGRPRPMARIEQHRAPGPHSDIPLRLYVPRNLPAGPAPTLVFFHGGGFVIGDLDSYDPLCSFLAEAAQCQVLSVEYRLAPEHPFPAAIEDAVAAWHHIAAGHRDFGADPARLGVGGDSAGGHISAVLSQQLRGSGAPLPRHQFLIYPATDLTRQWPSHEAYGNGFLLDRSTMTWFKEQFLPAHLDPADPRISPLRAGDLSGLPPATVVLAGFDPLHDEGRAYGEALQAAGVPVEILHFETLIHGFASMPGISQGSRRAVTEMAAALRRSLNG